MPGNDGRLSSETQFMLRSIKQLYGDKLGALDGEIGQVKDFYFDDENWAVRYVVADTGSWLAGRLVLLSPHSFGRLPLSKEILRVNLTRNQIENSPSIGTHLPVSRQYEEEYHKHYGWPYYWQGDALWGMSDVPVMELPSMPLPSEPGAQNGTPSKNADAHLRSAHAVSGYQIRAIDGAMGHICDFMIDSRTWAICELIIKIGHRFSGKEVQIPTSKVSRISYDESTVFVNLTSDAVEKSPTPHLAPAGVVD
jgi:hypothetical protein